MAKYRYKELTISDLPVQVIRKPHMKNLRLTVKAPDGQLVVSCPYYVSDAQIIDFVESRIAFIRQSQDKVRRQAEDRKAAQARQRYQNGQTIELLGQPYVLELDPDANGETQEALLHELYRQVLAAQLPLYTAKAESWTGLKAKEYRLKKMKTRWGTCNPTAKRIWLSTKLAAYPPQCLEYILVHELVHLVEKDHGERFQALVNQYYPNWREAELLLNGPHSKYL